MLRALRLCTLRRGLAAAASSALPARSAVRRRPRACSSQQAVPAAPPLIPHRHILRAGWPSVPALGFGSPDGAATADGAQRGASLFAAVVAQGARLVLVDGDAVARASAGASAAGAAPSWEAAALRRVCEAGGVPRADLVLCAGFAPARASAPALATAPASAAPVPALGARVAAAAAALGGYLDLALLQVSGGDAGASDDALREALSALDAAVAAGVLRGYGLHARDWHALDAVPGGSGTSLPRLFRLVEERGAAAAARCVAISSPASLQAPGPLLPAAVDGAGRTWSVAELAARRGMAVLLTAPLDCQLPARAFEAAVAAGEGRPPPAAAAPAAVRPFRCVDAPLHVDRHPSRLAALLNDIVNFAIHCELLWDRRVRALVAEERALEERTGVAAGGGGGGGGGGISERPAPLPLARLADTDVAWAQLLLSRVEHPGFFTLTEWQHVKHTRLLPALARLASATQGVEAAREWTQCYRALMAELADKVEALVEQRHAHQARALGRQLLADMAAGGPAPPPPPPPAARHWGRDAAPPLQAVVARILLAAAPNSFLVSEVPDLHRLTTRASARVRVEEAAGVALGAGAPPPPAHAAPPPPPDISAQAAQAVLAAAVEHGRVLAAATAPLPDWPDPLAGTPTQAELAPLQEAMRKLARALPAPSSAPAPAPAPPQA